MRVEFIVTGADADWQLRRGRTTPLKYRSCEAALRAAMAMARAAAQAGDRATVTLDAAPERQTFDFAAERFNPVDLQSPSSRYASASIRRGPQPPL